MRCGAPFDNRLLTRSAAALIALLSSSALSFAGPQSTPDSNGSPGAEYTPLSEETQAALRDLLNYDPAQAIASMPTSPLRARAPNLPSYDFDWNRTDKSDGSAAVTVKKPLPLGWSAAWDAKVGADIGVAAAPATTYQPERIWQPDQNRDTGTAWANVTVPGLASVDARVDPSKDQSKLGTTFSRTLPFGTNYSLTLQNSFVLTEQMGGAQTSPVLPAPTTSSAAAAAAAGTPPSQFWNTERLAKFNILSTGTTIGAGTYSSTTDYVTHNKILAEQKLFNNFNVTTAVTDVGTATASKSIKAGFKFKW